MSAVPERQYCRSFPNAGEIQEFLKVLRTLRTSAQTKELFVRLASYPPELRLAMNLKTFLGMNALHEVKNILSDGLTDIERKALVELDSSRASVRIREIAAGLLNVHEKWIAIRALGKSFREARAAHGQYVVLKPLDDILGDSEE